MVAIVAAAWVGVPKKTRWANRTVSKNRPKGAAGKLFVNNSQSTALRAANSAAPPAKKRRMASGLPQMRWITGQV
jgi:hypothetical protein